MSSEKRYNRFSVLQRIEHVILLLSFTTLGFTGIPQKYSDDSISQAVLAFLGGIEIVRIIHRSAATIFVVQSIYHFIVMGYKLYVQRKAATMVPNLKDLTDAFQSFFFNLGFIKKAPRLPRYNFAEKAEYLALLWGLLVMASTGYMLWNPIYSAKLFPGAFIPAAKAAHGGEAVLAVLAIILWHFYNVHIKHLNLAMLNGGMTHEEMDEEHGQELDQIESGNVQPDPDPAQIKRRLAIYRPVAAVFGVGCLAVILLFTTAESTAITTIPVEQRGEVYVPQTPTPFPPTPTAQVKPTASPDVSGQHVPPTTWNGGIGAILDTNCSVCHGQLAGLNLQTYANALKGGQSGVVIVPGEPANSLLIAKIKVGNHPGKFSQDEFKAMINWIQAGAPEK